MHLTLLVPELIWPEPADQFTLGKLAAPGLEWLLAHARLEHRPRRPFESALAACCGIDDAPFGALRLLGEGFAEATEGHWLCADPVHLRFHHERIVLADAGAFELEEAEAQGIVDALNGEFADIGEFRRTASRHWYLRLHTAVDHPVAPLSAIAGRRVDGELNGSALPLTRWLNEVQMFLHGHPVNEQRQATGQPAINSLWLWGGGRLPEQLSTAFTDLWSDNPLAAGLAQVTGTPRHQRPATLTDFLPQAGERPLVILDQLLPRVLYEDGEGWRHAFEQLESDWFAPLRTALGGKVERISLIAPTVYGELHYDIAAGERWKFWKKGSPLPVIAEQLAGQSNTWPEATQ
ncbi:MAG: hypothetical protein ACM3X0_11915 [Bacteroidota bacterium]